MEFLEAVVLIGLVLVSLGPLVTSIKDILWPEEWPPVTENEDKTD